jgi:hypothetical protein
MAGDLTSYLFTVVLEEYIVDEVDYITLSMVNKSMYSVYQKNLNLRYQDIQTELERYTSQTEALRLCLIEALARG